MLWLILISAQMFSPIVRASPFDVLVSTWAWFLVGIPHWHIYSDDKIVLWAVAITWETTEPLSQPVSDGLWFPPRVCGSSRDYKTYQRSGEEKFCRPVLGLEHNWLISDSTWDRVKKEVAVHRNPSGRKAIAMETYIHGKIQQSWLCVTWRTTDWVSVPLASSGQILICLSWKIRENEHSPKSWNMIIEY